jgi:hypothetical protein
MRYRFFGVFENGAKTTFPKPFKFEGVADFINPVETYAFQKVGKAHFRPA